MQRLVHWIPKTKDKKTGEVIASYSPKDTCPDSCSLKEGGCYAWGLFYLKILSNRLTDGRTEPTSLSIALKNIKNTVKIARHRIAGDVVGDVEHTLAECKEIDSAGLINIGYTHTWKEEESQPLKQYFRASCESLEELIDARNMGWSTTLIVPKGTDKIITMPNGEKAVLCPARHDIENKKDITCNTCKLCRVDEKTQAKTIMFEVHGNAATLKSANKALGISKI